MTAWEISWAIHDSLSALWNLQVLALGAWIPDFRPSLNLLPRATVWLRLLGLPPSVWTRAALELIVAPAGRLVKLVIDPSIVPPPCFVPLLR